MLLEMTDADFEYLKQWQREKAHDCSDPVKTGDDVCSNETCYCCEFGVYFVNGPCPMIEDKEGPGWLCGLCYKERHQWHS